MQITLPNGIVLDDQDLWAPALQKYASGKGLNTIRAFVAIDTDGSKQYLLVDGEQVIMENRSFEACCCRIDIMAAAKNMPA